LTWQCGLCLPSPTMSPARHPALGLPSGAIEVNPWGL
jgi:hypothetical protein